MLWLNRMSYLPAQSLATDLSYTKVRKPLEVWMTAVPVLVS